MPARPFPTLPGRIAHQETRMSSITLTSGASFDCPPGTSLLDAAATSSITLPYSCKTGRCSTCKCRVVSGTSKLLQPEMGLSESEKQAGWILSCVRTAESAMTLEAETLAGVTLPAVRNLPCRVSTLERVARDVLRVRLRLPPTADFTFLPGQYVDITGPAGISRSYSLASASVQNKTLELHIRAVPGGLMSQYWFEQAQPNDLLRLKGPLGSFFLRPAADRDIVLLATGTGIAPIKAILESLPGLDASERPRSVTLLWGGRSETDLYMDLRPMLLPTVRYIPVLSRSDASWTGARGHVQDAFLAEPAPLDNIVVYACGSEAMIKSASEAFQARGLSPGRFHSDAFVCSATPTPNAGSAT